MSSFIKRFIILAAMIWSVGCSPLTLQPERMIMGMDRTMTASHVRDGQPLVLVTIADEMHRRLVQGQRVDKEGNLPPLYANFLARLSRHYGLERVADWPLGSLHIHCLVFESKTPATTDLLTRLRAEQYVETVQTLNYYTASADVRLANAVYDDPYYDMQPGHKALQVDASHGWATGKGVRIAIIDTGVDTEHADLAQQLAGIKNFVDRSTSSFRTDVHGTAVAGVIAAATNNGLGMVGIAPDARLYALKACAQQTSRGSARCTSFTLAKAINFAIEEQVDIINLSLTGPKDSLLARLVAKALSQGILVIGAAGNKPDDQFPGRVKGVITVAKKDSESDDAIVAPGSKILTTVPNNGYDFFSGSSFAAAHVTGIAALIRQRKPHLSSAVVKQLLAGTSDETSGYTNACDALARVVTGGACPTDPVIVENVSRL